MRRAIAILATVVVAGSLIGAVGVRASEPTVAPTDKFAFDVLNPGMEFAWTTHRIRLKLLARLGVPDEMDLKTVPDRTSDWWYAQERWAYHGGPTLIINSNDYEWLERISIPVNTQIPLPFDLIVGSTRDEYLSALQLEDKGKSLSDPISFSSGRPTHVGHSCVTVLIEFDEKGNSQRVTWESGCH